VRINWLAPLPPAKTGVAHYSRDLLPLLAQHAEVLCWTPQDRWDRDIEAYARVATIGDNAAFWQEINRGDLTICHIGNNAFAHGEIWEFACHHPSLVVLHEARLFDLFAGITLRIARDPDRLRSKLVELYGEPAGRALEQLAVGAVSLGELLERYPMTELAVAGALGVLCHSEEACLLAGAAGPMPVVLAALPAPPGPPAPDSEIDLARIATCRRLIAFGHFGADHQLLAVFEALADHPRRAELHLDVFGEIGDFERVAGHRDRLGLQQDVTLHGFVVESTLHHALERADLAINLRAPSTGGGSAAQLRIWSYGLPSVVMARGCFAGLNPAEAFLVHPERVRQGLHQAFDAMLADDPRLTAMSKLGRERLQRNHPPRAYVEALLALAEVCVARVETAAQARLQRRLLEATAAWPLAAREALAVGMAKT
jgi:hypothetical protein